jgi:hypothetical protein
MPGPTTPFPMDDEEDNDPFERTIIAPRPPDPPIEGMGTLPDPIPMMGGPVPSVEYLKYIGDSATYWRRFSNMK